MCWKYEDLYDGYCFDHLYGGTHDGDIVDLFHYGYGIQINDKQKFVEGLFNLLSKYHEEKVIEPLKTTDKYCNIDIRFDYSDVDEVLNFRDKMKEHIKTG